MQISNKVTCLDCGRVCFWGARVSDPSPSLEDIKQLTKKLEEDNKACKSCGSSNLKTEPDNASPLATFGSALLAFFDIMESKE